jgi:hypothetical protein
MLLPPGRDARSIGSEPCVFVEFSRGIDYIMVMLTLIESSRPANRRVAGLG